MSEQNSSLSRKRNVLIGGGVAIAAALLALSYTMDFPSGVQNTVGTIVPAQRYKAAQPVIEDIKASGQAATQSVPLQAGSARTASSSALGARLLDAKRRADPSAPATPAQSSPRED